MQPRWLQGSVDWNCSIIAGRFHDFRKKAAPGNTTDQTNSQFQTGRFKTGTTLVVIRVTTAGSLTNSQFFQSLCYAKLTGCWIQLHTGQTNTREAWSNHLTFGSKANKHIFKNISNKSSVVINHVFFWEQVIFLEELPIEECFLTWDQTLCAIITWMPVFSMCLCAHWARQSEAIWKHGRCFLHLCASCSSHYLYCRREKGEGKMVRMK